MNKSTLLNNTMNELSVISIDHLNQLIPALAAFKYKKKNEQGCSFLILTKPHIQFNSIKKAHLYALLRNESSVEIIFGNTLFKNPELITRLPVRLRAILLYKQLKQYPIKEIYFSHDVSSDFWNQTLMQAFPKATRICYGDALGLVYTQHYFNQLMYRIFDTEGILFHNILARIKRSLLFPNKKHQLLAQHAVLTIPCDPGNDFFKQCSLSIIKQNEFKHYVTEIAARVPDFKRAMYDLIKDNSQPYYLMMLSNFSESKLTTINNEILLYKEILSLHAHKDSIIIVKPHPAHNPDMFKQIITELEKEYTIKVMDNQFYDLPIELAESLVLGCKVLSVSYSSVSLPYLYKKNVTHVLTPELINKYFLSEKKKWFMESNNLYLRMMHELKHWNQEHELYV